MGATPWFRQSRRRLLKLLGGTAGLAAGLGAGVSGRRPGGRPASAGRRHTRRWTQQQRLTADDGDSVDFFGSSVAVSADGTTATVGAWADEDPNGNAAGSVYVFARTGDDWTQAAKLAADDGDRDDRFGYSVAVSSDGTTAVVGAPDDEDPNGANDDGTGAGSVYVFDGSGDEWTQAAKLAADDGDGGDSFGSSVDISGDGSTALVGARSARGPGGGSAGSAYVFDGSGDEWTQAAKLAADDGDDGDLFGVSVTLAGDGTAALVGAPEDADPNGESAGAAYAFERSGDGWTQATKVAADDGDSADAFGISVSLARDGTTAVVGASGDEDPGYEGAGSAYVLDGSGGEWTQAAKLAGDGDRSDKSGDSVAISADGTTISLGAPMDTVSGALDSGSAYVFERDGTGWTGKTKLAADDGDRDDNLGSSVAVSGDGATVLAGAPDDDTPGGNSAGSVSVFEQRQPTPEPTTGSTTAAGESSGQAGETGADEDPDEEAAEDDSEDDENTSVPGFGVGSLLAGLTGTGYLLWRRSEDGNES